MIDPVILISVGFFVILCLLAKLTGVNDVTSDIVDDENADKEDDDLTDIKSIEDIDTSKYDIIQMHYDLDAPIPGVTYFADGSTKGNPIEDVSKDNTVYLIHKKDNNDQLAQLIEPEPIQNNNDIIKETHTHILNFSSKEKELINLSGTTLISLKSIKQ